MSLVATAPRQWILPHRVRQSVLTAHVMVSVGLLGDSAGFLAVAIRAANTADAATVTELVKVLSMFSVVFGIPLSAGALVSGLALGLGGKWRVFRYPWVTAKLLLIVSVATPQLIAAATYDVLALSVATILSVFKPGGPFRRRTTPGFI